MISKKIVATAVICVLLIVILFEITWVQNASDARSGETPDLAVEAHYENCYAIRDDAMHREAFGTIDNPDVQRGIYFRKPCSDRCRVSGRISAKNGY